MYTWEPSFSSKLLAIRENEMKYLRKIATVTAFSALCSIHSPFFVSMFVMFSTYIKGSYRYYVLSIPM